MRSFLWFVGDLWPPRRGGMLKAARREDKALLRRMVRIPSNLAVCDKPKRSRRWRQRSRRRPHDAHEHAGNRQVVRLILAEHVPEDHGQAAHHGHPRDLRSAAALDPQVPLPHVGVLAQHVHHQLAEQVAGQRAALLGDGADAFGFVGVRAAWREAPIVGQAPRRGKAADVADAAAQPPAPYSN